ncbi:hypothetical protein ABZ502_17865 [Streptomyces abikoensis]|uniref:hypothetical protein n=1 Tax=Streptomyces abikoensis TaxID=97398 RepID=UPI003401D1D9
MTVKNARRRTGELARTIVLDLWPHSDALGPWYGRRLAVAEDLPAEHLRVPAVTSASDVQVDDLVLVFDQRRKNHYDLLGLLTAREAVDDRETAVARVIAKTERTVTVLDCMMPNGYWSSCNLDTFGAARPGAEARTMRLNTSRRQIGYLGSLAGIRQRLINHEDFEAWRTGFAASAAEEQAAQTERQARWAAEQERLRPLREAAAQLNQIAGEDLMEWDCGATHPYGGVRLCEWLREPGRLRTYLAGLNAMGAIADGAYILVEQHLDVIGC